MNYSSTQFQQIFDIAESLVSERETSYKGTSKEALLTSSEDFRTIFSYIKDCKSFLDLGCGHGIGVIEFAKMYSHAWSGGIDFESSRLEAGKKMALDEKLTNCHFIESDLLISEIPIVDAYFLYFPTGIKKEKWLELEAEIPLRDKRHYPFAQIFKKCSQRRRDLHSISFKNKFLTIRQDHRLWLADSFGLEWVRDDEFLLKTPPRTIRESDVLEVNDFEFLSTYLQKMIQLRQLGRLTIKTGSEELSGEIRKIFFSPKIELEISSAGNVNWESIEKIFTESSLCYDSSSGFAF